MTPKMKDFDRLVVSTHRPCQVMIMTGLWA